MTISPWLGYALGVAAIGMTSRLWVRFRRDRVARAEHRTPLFDEYFLGDALQPRMQDGDDRTVLSDLRSTLSHLNRRSYVQEFWDLNNQLEAYYLKLPRDSRPTMRRALLRLLTVNNRWLQIVAAKTCAALHLSEAVPPLRAIVEIGEGMSPSPETAIPPDTESAETRFLKEIELALTALETGARLR